MFSWLSWLWGPKRPAAPGAPRPIHAGRSRYDAAQTNEDNYRHWAGADGLSPARANDPAVRRTLRNRARYEAANNSYCRGIVSTLTNDVIGVGPRLQLLTADADVNRKVEAAFAAWARDVRLAEKLRTAKTAKTVDGEQLLVLTTNPAVPGPVRLDFKVIEADHLADPSFGAGTFAPASLFDGIEYDAAGNPSAYWVAREHPGDMTAAGPRSDRLPADQVIHWFRADRPGQLRGVPEITAALPLFAQLRRYTLAVIAAAETAADFAAVLQSDAPPDGADPADPFESLEIERRMMTTLPAGWKMGQFRAEQPATTYDMFKREVLNEIARCLNMSYNVAAGNSSSYNYASGRLDHQTYHKSVRVEQGHCEAVVLARLFMAWLQEAMFIPGLLPAGLPPFAELPFTWLWPGWEHVDPLKEASAQAQRLANHTTTLAEEYGRRGMDWEAQLEQRSKEVRRMEELGLTVEQSQPRRQPADGEEVPADE